MADEMTFKHVLPVQIRFNDVDQYGHMNNSSYFSLYDLAKTSYLRDVFGQKEWNRIGIVVANINADFLAPVFFSDELVIETSVVHLGHKSFTLLQRAVDKVSGIRKCQCRTALPRKNLWNFLWSLNRPSAIMRENHLRNCLKSNIEWIKEKAALGSRILGLPCSCMFVMQNTISVIGSHLTDNL